MSFTWPTTPDWAGPVALKALTRQFTRDSERRERLRREARAAAGLSHSGIATVYALEEFDDDLYIVSEYVPGKTLRDEVSQGRSHSAYCSQPASRLVELSQRRTNRVLSIVISNRNMSFGRQRVASRFLTSVWRESAAQRARRRRPA